VIISDSNFSCGDDCVAITCVTDWNIPSERIIISNCIMRSRSSAVRIGYWQSQVRNVIVSNLIIHDSNRGIGIFAGENGRVADVQISNIISETRLVPGAWWGHGEPLAMLATHARGYIHGISVSGIRAVSESGLIIYSEQSGNVSDISINNCAISLRQGRDRDIFLPVYDTQPADLISAPDPLVHLPWLTAIKATGLSLQNIRATYAADERPAYKIDALIENCSDCRQTNVLVEESDAVS
jgi:hypothetical protein